MSGPRPDARIQAKLLRWVEAYRQKHPEKRGRTVHATYGTGRNAIRVAFPPTGRTTTRRAAANTDRDRFTRSEAERPKRPNLFSMLFGGAANAAPASNGVNLRAAARPVRAAAQTGGRVAMANAQAKRNLPIDARLRGQLDRMAQELGVRVEVFSGGQPARGEGGTRTGSTRHDHGRAADVRVYRNGRLLTGKDLAPVVQYWLGRGIGGVGYGMADGGTHLDIHTNRARFWAYTSRVPAEILRATR